MKKYAKSGMTYGEYCNIYKSRKTSLRSIIKDPDKLNIINKVVLNINKLIIHTYNILKLYYIHNYSKHNKIINIDISLLRNITKIICTKNNSGKKLSTENQTMYNKLSKFYTKYYKDIMFDKITSTNLNNVIDYELIGIITCIKNHVTNHFRGLVNRYINIVTKKDKLEKKIEKDSNLTNEQRKIMIRKLRTDINLIKVDVLNCTTNCDVKYHKILKRINNLLPPIPKSSNVIKYLHTEPLQFISTLVGLSIDLETSNHPPINCFPLRKNITPKYITLDTLTILNIFKSNNITEHRRNIIKCQDNIWDLHFKTNKKIFNTSTHKFNYQIMTDGIGCSIQLIQKEYLGKKIRHMKPPKNHHSELYIDQLSKDKLESLSSHQIIGIDPGKIDLIYATDGNMKNDKRIRKFRYSQNQRRKELKIKKYRDIRNNNSKINKVYLFEKKLSMTNSKSCILSKIRSYLKIKNWVNKFTLKTYEQELYRRLRWYSFINKQRTEAKMINQFKEEFKTDIKPSIICIGDYEQKQQLKYSEPTKGKSFRNLFRNAGFEVYLIDEYKTSAMSYFTQTETVQFRRRGNPRPWKKDIRLCRGLLRSKNVTNNKSTEHILVDRDLNGALNIRLKGKCIINGDDIPKYMNRKQFSHASSALNYKLSSQPFIIV